MSPHTQEERNEKFKQKYPEYNQVNSFRCHVTEIDEEANSYWVRVEDEKTLEQYEMELEQDKIEKKLSIGNIFWLHVGESKNKSNEYIHYIELNTLVWTAEMIDNIKKDAAKLSQTFQ